MWNKNTPERLCAKYAGGGLMREGRRICRTLRYIIDNILSMGTFIISGLHHSVSSTKIKSSFSASLACSFYSKKSQTRLFADAYTIFREVTSWDECEVQRTCKWQLHLNLSKCKSLCISSKEIPPVYTYSYSSRFAIIVWK